MSERFSGHEHNLALTAPPIRWVVDFSQLRSSATHLILHPLVFCNSSRHARRVY